MKIEKLKKIDANPTMSWGHNGYISDHIFHAKSYHTPSGFSFELEKIKIPFTKNWITTEQDIELYNDIIDQGYSYGAFDNNRLVAWIIIEYRDWNKSLYIENILVAEAYRNKGLGKKLIDSAKTGLAKSKARIMELETQNTNTAAIAFYESQGFHITGLNLKLYSDLENEFAIFMSFEFL